MKKSVIKKSLFALFALFTFSFTFHSCDSWMSDDDNFYEEIENEVKKANAPQISVFVRYAATKMGKTDPDGYSTFKVEIPSTITATTEIDYGFKRWAAFSTSFLTPGDTQYTNFVYEDDESYAANYGQYELSSDIVRFENPTSTTTSVTIYEERNDIYIVPVVAKRPTIALTMPASGSSGIVRNMTVRINFTKQMNPASFKDANGAVDKITITQGTQSITSDGDIEISSTEITNRFAEPAFSTNGKMITLKFTPEAISEGFTAQSYVTINISKDVTDIYGYSMAEDYKLQFQVGSSFDTLAPRISELTAGVGQNYNTFGGVYKDADTVSALGSLTQIKLDGAAGANADIDNNPLYTDSLLAQRIKDKVNIRVVAEDLAGSGSGQDTTGAESEVSMIGVRATSIALMSGAAAAESNAIPLKSLAYVGQTNTSEIQGSYRDITGANKGFLFTYDVSSLPDGLIKIDVWAYDSIGNSGLLDGGAYSSEYGNGYASIFVVKDTTPPDAAANTPLIGTSSTDAPYGWYNATTLGSMKLYEVSPGSIFDNGHPRLRSKADKLQWFFNVTSDTSWAQGVTKDDARWVNVSDGYSIANAAVPASDGPVALSLILKDDLGNISTAAPLSSIMYDNTAASVSTLTWVNGDGTDAVNNVTGTNKPAQILKIPFDGNISGVKRLYITCDKYANPLETAVIKYAGSGEAPSNAAVIASSIAGNLVELPASYLSGVFYIEGLTIGSAEGINTISVVTYDSALNASEAVSRTISVDTNAPVINSSISVGGEFESTRSDNNKKHYIPNTAFVGAEPVAASLSFTITEVGSGIHAIKISGGDVEFIPGSTSIAGLSAADYTVVSATEIQLPDSYNPKIIGANVTVTINNVKFNYTAADPRNGSYFAELTVEDFLDKPSGAKQSYNDFFIDNIAPTIASVEVSDKESKSVNGFTNPASPVSTEYTDSSTVTLKVKVGVEDGSGVYQFVLNGAVFTNATPCADASAAGNTVTFAKPLISGTEVTLSGVQLSPETEGAHTISVTPVDRVGWAGSAVNSNSIIYDATVPVFSANPKWTATSGAAVGVASGDYLDTQILNIPFTDAHAGVKKFRISLGSAITDPIVNNSNLKVGYNGTEITGITVATYDVGSNHYGEITLPTPVTSGTLTVQGIHANISTDATYTVTVALMDAAYNSSESASVNSTLELTHDQTAPVINKIEIPGLKLAKDIFSKESKGWWLDHEYIGGPHNNNYAATQVPLYITINEKTSGVNLITLDGGTLELQSNSTLWTVASDGTEKPYDPAKYTVDTTAKTITINNASDSLKNPDGKDEFVILIKDLKATKTGNNDYNTISVRVDDVALNKSASKTLITVKDKTQTLSEFYTDSWNCGIASVEIEDGDASPVPATAGYTNNKIVTVNTTYGGEGSGASGHNKFTFTGAKFTNASKVYIATSISDTNSALENVKNPAYTNRKEVLPSEYVISQDQDKTTLEFRNADATEYYVVINIFALQITNMELDNATTDGTKTVVSYASDLSGWNSGEESGSIILDTTPPEWRFDAGTFAANSEKVNGTFIYPHPDEETAYGIKSPTDEKNKDGEIVRYYYTASKLVDTDDYGVVIGIGGKDANLRGYDKKNGVPYYICDTTDVSLSVIDAKYVVTHGSMPSTDCNGNTTGNNPGWKTELNGWEIMKTGYTYSIVIVDEAGNYSTAKTIKIVQDTEKPSVTGLTDLMTLQIPGDAKIFRNENAVTVTITPDEAKTLFYDDRSHSTNKYGAYCYVIKGSSGAADKYKIVVKLNSGKTATDVQLDGTTGSTAQSYTQAKPSASDSGLEYYAVSHWYGNWGTNGSNGAFEPAFPNSDSVTPTGQSIKNYFGYGDNGNSNWLTSKINWHAYNSTAQNSDNSGELISYVENGDIVIEIPENPNTPPMALLLKDACGNMNFVMIRPTSFVDTDNKKVVSWVVDSMLSTDTSAPANRHVGFIPYATTNKKENDSNVTNDSNYNAIDLNGNVTASTYNWGNPTGPYQIGGGNLDGQTVIGTQARDLYSGITYYNEKAYIGIALKAETCNYSTREISSSNFADGKGYTLRARIVAWNAIGAAPEKKAFEEGSGSDFSSWLYLRDDGTDGNNNIFLQYPHPTRESKFRLYYYVEDAVGNYEINTITNDNKADGADGQMLYWMYDNAGPSVLTQKNKLNPAEINGNNIGELVATNNGYRPYYNGGTGYVVKKEVLNTGHSLPPTSSLGNGIILGCAYDGNRKYGNYFDLDIIETSGIRAFAYTSTPAVPTIPTSGNYSCSTMGDESGWYAGMTTNDGGTGILYSREIGTKFSGTNTYKPTPDGKSVYSNAGDVYYDYYNSSYGKDVYSGVKVVATIPWGVVKETATDVYLHVMDWVGNITTVKLGNGIKWVNDSAGANNDGNPDTNIFKDNCNITCYNIEKPWNLQYTFASTKIPSDATSIKIYMPEGKYSDDAGSGLLGWSLTPYKLNSVEKDAGQTDAKYSYIEITDDILTKIKKGEEAGEIPVYIYDNVGNCAGVTLKLVGDNTPIPFTMNVRAVDSTGAKSKSYVVETLSYMDGTTANGNNLLGAEATLTQKTTQADVDLINSVAYTKDGYVVFLPCFGAYDATSHSDYYKTVISRWNGTTWEPLDSSSTTALNGWLHTPNHTDNKRYYTSKVYTLDAAKPYYQFAVYDNAGNVNYLYAKVMQDNTPPTATLVTGSIEKVNQVGGENYYNSNSKAKMKYSDTGAGLKEYGAVTSVPTYTTSTDEIEVNLGTMTPSSGKLTFTAKDNLENGGSINLTYNGSETWVKDIDAPTYTPIANQSIVKKGGEGVSASTKSENFRFDAATTRQQASLYVQTDDNGVTNLIVNPQVKKFTFIPPELTESNFYGWKIQTTPLTDTSWFNISTGGTVNDLSSGYSFGSSSSYDMAIPSKDANVSVYFYPIDKAGNIGTPIILKFVDAPLPVVSSVTPVGLVNNCYNDNSSVNVTARYSWGSGNMPIEYIGISDGTTYKKVDVRSENVILTASGQNHEFTNISLADFTGTDFEFEIITNYTSSVIDNNSKLTGITPDRTGPTDIKVKSVKDQNNLNTYAIVNGDTGVTFGGKATSVTVEFEATDAVGVAGFATSADSLSWTSTLTFASPTAGTKSIYAKDMLGNVSTAASIVFTEDSTVSDVTSVTITPGENTKTYYDSVGKTLYYNGTSVTVTPSTSDTDIDYFYYNDVSNKSTGGSFTITPADAIYTFYAVDKLGNVSSTGYAVTFTKDDSVNTPTATLEWYNGETPVASPDNYLYDAGTTVYYNSNKLNKIVFTPSATPDASGIVGYATSSTAADADWNPTTVEITAPSGAITIYAKDRVGNVSEPLSFNYTADGLGVELSTTGSNISNSVGAFDEAPSVTVNGVSNTVSGTVEGKDDIVGTGYTTQFIPANSTFTVTVDGAYDDLAGYAFTIGNTSAVFTEPSTFTAITGSSSLTLPLPDITEAHAYVFLWLKDRVGNVTYYNICNSNKNWWLTQNNPAGFTWKVDNGKIVLTGLKNVPLKSISVTGDSINSVEFGFDIDTNHKASKSYTNNNASSLGGCFAGEDKITLTVSNASNVTDVSVTTIYSDTPITGTKEGLYASAARFVASAASSVKSFFTPKSKKVDLTAQSRIADKSELTSVNSVSLEPVERFEPVKKSELASAKAKPVKNQPARTKKIASRSADSTKVSSISAVSPVIPENAKVLEAKPIQLTVESEEHIINVVENNPSPQRRVPASLVIFTMVTVIAVAGIFITSKKIIDKYN